MKINVPEINEIIEKCIDEKSSFDSKDKKISTWMEDQERVIKNNEKLINEKNDVNDMKILRILIADYLMRAMKGERGTLISTKLEEVLKTKDNLTESNYRTVIRSANYRWGEEIGTEVISEVVKLFMEKKAWDFAGYFEEARQKADNNFVDDEVLTKKYISFKVRDLALSNFNENYVAFDLHLARVPTRIGLLNYGFDLLHVVDAREKIEMGNNPANNDNYLFLHRLFRKFSLDSGYSMVKLDRFFWHFGRVVCNDKPNCKGCPINDLCLTGIHRKKGTIVPQ